MKEYLDMWKNYANFSGRTSIRGYWMAFLFNTIIGFVVGVITGLLPVLAFIGTIYTLAALIPGLALPIRRLRDAGKSWACIFLPIIPIIGAIILIVKLCRPSVAAEDVT